MGSPGRKQYWRAHPHKYIPTRTWKVAECEGFSYTVVYFSLRFWTLKSWVVLHFLLLSLYRDFPLMLWDKDWIVRDGFHNNYNYLDMYGTAFSLFPFFQGFLFIRWMLQFTTLLRSRRGDLLSFLREGSGYLNCGFTVFVKTIVNNSAILKNSIIISPHL